jgi:hypothetical protein
MQKYPKIQTVFLRDPETNHRYLLEGQYALPEFDYLCDCKWNFTEKIDGTNIRVDWDHEEKRKRIGGRTDNAQIPVFLLDKLHDLLPLEKFEESYPDTPMTLYGEGYGAKIQKGGGNYIPDGVSFILFDVLISDFWLKREDVHDIADHLEIDVVPEFGSGTLYEAVDMVREGFLSKAGSQVAEGLVMRPEVELRTRRGDRIMSKIKYKDFAR